MTQRPPDPARAALMRDKNFVWLMAGSIISMLGDQFSMLALPWLVLGLTGDSLSLGIAVALMGAPRAVLILLGGAIADRYSPRRVLLLSKYANAVILLALLINLYMKVSYMKKRYRKMMTGADGANLERMLIGHLNEIQEVSEENAAIKRENERLDGLLQLAITRVGVVRFRAFDDMGSDLSYAVALLDSYNDGVILTSIFGREDSRSYVKPVEKGQSTYQLMPEEQQALDEAMRKGATA